ncbi:hypothetical protein [Sphingomonas crocodyli]|uniref:Uncharacterized protein n=1 Tax=Sphingomonas crocodyli TaxID=1979270 RepID=A0A437LY14_9SPHN|nr:hypothetical protein [Sphingomonas crocodyli]RVT90254.1 hypothetical protein EOD43_18350 [Sphingomonas crocodyli]
MAALAAWEWNQAGVVRRRRTWIIVAAILTLAGLFAYLVLYSLFIEPIRGTNTRETKGFTCTAQARELYWDQCPDLPRDALRDAEVSWTRSSITIVRLAMTAAWMIFTAALICAVTAVVMGDRAKRSVKRRITKM